MNLFLTLCRQCIADKISINIPFPLSLSLLLSGTGKLNINYTSSLSDYIETKSSVTPANVRFSVRRKFSTIATTEMPTVSTTHSRPTKIKHRRKYLTRSTTRRLESQVPTTPRLPIENRYRFISRRPNKSTTPKQDQTLESSNQPPVGIKQQQEKSIELGDLAVALQSIQKAPVPQKTTAVKMWTKPQTQAKIIQTTPRNYNRIQSKGTRPRIILNKTILSTAMTPTYDSVQPVRYISTSPSPLFITFLSSTLPQREAYRKVTPSSIADSYPPTPSSQYDHYQTPKSANSFQQLPAHSKVLLHSNGVIECLDQGNFPHPVSCKKFISCADMGAGKLLGWEYTCPKNLSFDPIGGICNWSTGLGCDEH